jgi:hypothetical protein
MGTAKSSKSPKSPKSPKTVKHRKPDKITYHPLIGLPEVGLPITDADRVKLFRIKPSESDRISRIRENMKRRALDQYKRNIPPDQYDAAMEKTKQINAKLKEQLQKFRDKDEAHDIAATIKETTEQLDKFKRDKKLHDFQAKKEDKIREQAKLLELWKSENPPYAGEGATAYVADSSDEDTDSSPPGSSFFGFFDKFKSPKYNPLRKAGVRPKKLSARTHMPMHVYEPANSDKRWKEFRAYQIKTDEGNILRLENDLKDYREKLAKYRSGGRGRIMTIRRRSRRRAHVNKQFIKQINKL